MSSWLRFQFNRCHCGCRWLVTLQATKYIARAFESPFEVSRAVLMVCAAESCSAELVATVNSLAVNGALSLYVESKSVLYTQYSVNKCRVHFMKLPTRSPCFSRSSGEGSEEQRSHVQISASLPHRLDCMHGMRVHVLFFVRIPHN